MMLEVVLAGCNADRENPGSGPETISAAYARISRDPRPIGRLRAEAAGEVEKARRSNRRIIFQYGHSSVAEHAVFNFDICGLSRLGAEHLQSFRLASFTEKSQRYIRIGRDYMVPEELGSDAADGYAGEVSTLFGLYADALAGLEGAGMPSETAREDARYLLPLCTTCQMGLTVNARELEHMVRRMGSSPLAEIRHLSVALHDAAAAVAPSLLRHLEPSGMDILATSPVHFGCGSRDVELAAGDGDSVIGAMLARMSLGLDSAGASEAWRHMDGESRRELFDSVLEGLGPHEAPPRAWEHARYAFDIRLSASAFAQLKRHRMATLVASGYDDGNGHTIPPSFLEAGIGRLAGEAAAASGRIRSMLPGPAAAYGALNSSRRCVSLVMNARELYHFARLRCDSHAQWDIRDIAGRMIALAGARAPLTFRMACGKSDLHGTGSAGTSDQGSSRA
jgi:flavin-dependent thymidylate synthase